MKKLVDGPTEEMIAKLPLWARQHLEDVIRQRDTAERHIQRLEDERNVTLVGTDAPTRISWEYLMEGAHFLTSGANIRFYVGQKFGREEWITFRWRERDNCVDVNASSALIIQPQATNSVYLTIEER